jgi:hypothetical protein
MYREEQHQQRKKVE